MRMERNISIIISRTLPLQTLLFIALVITSSSAKNRTCPPDIQTSTDDCLRDYVTQMDKFHSSETLFFTGIDAEIIRSQICSVLHLALRCVHRVRDVCPASQHDEINEALTPHIAALQLCHHKDFFEEYAMMQNCFHGYRLPLETCDQDFKIRSGRHMSDVRDGRRSAVTHFCGQLTELTRCVRTKVATCGHKAEQLVEVLVKTSVELSYKCDEELHHSATATTKSRQRSSANGYNSATSFKTSSFVNRTVLLLLQLVTVTVFVPSIRLIMH